MPKKVRPIRVEGNVAYVTLTKGYVAVIDAADVHLVERHTWKVSHDTRDGRSRTVYAICHGNSDGRRFTLRMHRLLVDASKSDVVDHKDGDGLNNCRANLRVATPSENRFNQRCRSDSSSGVKGVHWDKGRGKWQVKIKANGRAVHLGRFDDMEAAAAAYAAASAKLHGDYGRTA